MCPACLGSALLLLGGTTSTGGLAALIAGRVRYRFRPGGMRSGPPVRIVPTPYRKPPDAVAATKPG